MTYLPGTQSRRRIYLMRHGHVDYLAKHVVTSGAINVVPLTPRGRLQAEAAGVALSHVKIEKAVCSGYPRTHETASYVLAAQKEPPQLEIDEGFVERTNGKQPPVKSREQLIELMRGRYTPEGVIDMTARDSDGGEPADQAQARAVAALRRMLKASGWHTGLVVAHEGINRLMLGWACGAGLGAGGFEQDTGCINVLDFDLTEEGEIKRTMIKATNLTPYNWLKHGMNLTSLEALFERNATEGLR